MNFNNAITLLYDISKNKDCCYEYSIKIKDGIINKRRFLFIYSKPNKSFCMYLCYLLKLKFNYIMFINKYLYEDFYIGLDNDNIEIYCESLYNNKLCIYSLSNSGNHLYKIDDNYKINDYFPTFKHFFYQNSLRREDGQIYFKVKDKLDISIYNNNEFNEFYKLMKSIGSDLIWIQVSDNSFTTYYRNKKFTNIFF